MTGFLVLSLEVSQVSIGEGYIFSFVEEGER